MQDRCKKGKLTFDVGEHHVEFGLFKDFESSPSTFSCCGCEVVDSNEPGSMIKMSRNDPSSVDCTLFEDSRLDNVKVDSFPPIIVETKPYRVDEAYLGACCKFFTLWMSMPPMGGGLHELDLDVEFDFGPYDGDGPKMIVFQDPSLGKTLRSKKDLNPETLRWFLLHQFDFEAVDKG